MSLKTTNALIKVSANTSVPTHEGTPDQTLHKYYTRIIISAHVYTLACKCCLAVSIANGCVMSCNTNILCLSQMNIFNDTWNNVAFVVFIFLIFYFLPLFCIEL